MNKKCLNKAIQILRYYRKKKTIKKCCEHFGITAMTVYRYLKIAGLTFYNTRSNTKNKDYFAKIDSESKAYYLGFIVADGNVSKKTNRISFTINSKDDYIFKQLKKELQCINKIRRYTVYDNRTNKYYKSSSFQFSGEKLKKDLGKYGIDQNKTTSFINPPKIPTYLFRHFMRGLFDGDGAISISKSTCRINIISTKQFLIFINKKLFSNMGSINPVTLNKNVWKLDIQNTGTCKDFLNYLYKNSTIYLKRKYNIFLKCKTIFPVNKNKIVEVLVYNKNRNIKKRFNSLKKCALYYGISSCHLCNYHLNKNMPKNGLFFKRGKSDFQTIRHVSRSHFNNK